MELPTLDESVDLLQAVAGLEDYDPDTPLLESGVDSLDMMEWLYALQERHPDLSAEESLLEDVDDTVTFRVIHERIVHAQIVATVAAAANDA